MRARGFTLIELIIVIILISILSSLGVGLFSGTDAYDARLAGDQWVSSLRLSQKLALLRQNSSELLTVTATQTSNEWLILLTQGTTALNDINISRDRIGLHTSTSDFSSACAALPLASFPIILYLDGYGNHVNASRVQATVNRRFCFVASQTVELCISPSGYAYNGSCEP
jgi:MSHA pilin protein MshC